MDSRLFRLRGCCSVKHHDGAPFELAPSHGLSIHVLSGDGLSSVPYPSDKMVVGREPYSPKRIRPEQAFASIRRHRAAPQLDRGRQVLSLNTKLAHQNLQNCTPRFISLQMSQTQDEAVDGSAWVQRCAFDDSTPRWL